MNIIAKKLQMGRNTKKKVCRNDGKNQNDKMYAKFVVTKLLLNRTG